MSLFWAMQDPNFHGVDLRPAIGQHLGINPPPRTAEELLAQPDGAKRELRRQAIRAEEGKQRPAAYRFSIGGAQIDLAPENVVSESPTFARDTYHELIRKARELIERLGRTNAALRPRRNTERLLEVLDGVMKTCAQVYCYRACEVSKPTMLLTKATTAADNSFRTRGR